MLCLTPLFANTYDAYIPTTGELSMNLSSKEYKTSKESYEDNGQFGLSIRAGLAQNDPKDMKTEFNTYGGGDFRHAKLKKGDGVFGLEIFYEKPLAEGENKYGAKLGVDFYGENELTLSHSSIYQDMTTTETTYAFPLTLYFKRDQGIKNWSWFIGGGVTVISSKISLEYAGPTTNSLSQKTFFPHITAGAEYRFNKVFALGLDVKYNIAAKVERYGIILSNRSGIGATVTGRFYF